MPRSRGLARCALAAMFAVLAPSVARADNVVIEIGVLAIRGDDWAHERFDATAQYLDERIDGYRFIVVPMTLADSDALVARDGVDFVITQPANYAVLEARHGLSRIGTMRNQTPEGPQTVFGGVIFVRSDRDDLRTLDDLPGHSLMAVDPQGLGGYLMAKGVLVGQGIDPDADLRLHFSGFPQDAVVHAVRDGEVDVGTVRTHVLERMAADGQLDLDQLRVLAPRTEVGFPYRLSTPLYPEWAFAVARSTDPLLARQVAVALLELPAEHPASVASRTAGWTVALDYGPVHDLLRSLREPPYEDYGRIGPYDVLRSYWPVVASTGLLGLLLLLGIGYAIRLNRRLRRGNEQLAHEVAERERAEHRLLASEKMASLGQLAAGVAHELNTPLGYVRSNEVELFHHIEDLLRLLDAYRAAQLAPPAADKIATLQQQIGVDALAEDLRSILEENADGLDRMKTIIADIQVFSHVGEVEWEKVDVEDLIERSLNLVRRDLGTDLTVEIDIHPKTPKLECVPSQLVQIFVNLLVNARDAAGPRGTLWVRARGRGSEVELEVEDDGPGIDEETRRRIFDPFFTTKEVGHGTGLGLAVALRIVEAHGGRIDLRSPPGKGARFRVVLPRYRTAF